MDRTCHQAKRDASLMLQHTKSILDLLFKKINYHIPRSRYHSVPILTFAMCLSTLHATTPHGKQA